MLDKIAQTPVAELKSREPVRVQPNMPLMAVVSAIKERRRGAAIVEDDSGTIQGIFTERDLMARLDHSSQAWHHRPVGDVMVRNPKTVEQSRTLEEALSIMIAGKFRHLPIVDSDRHVLGILSIRDILAHVASYFPQEFLNLPPDPDHEASEPWGG
ncbi:MAG: CBS domain-containing protein [Gammaproteobacteria bacterium]|nr:CBS domain-containing protein [Gammaproteobacteria bacterium]